MHSFYKQLLLSLYMIAILSTCYAQKAQIIRPGEIWPDNNGKYIQAHGGGIIKLDNTYYWYGEERSQRLDTNYRYVSCYSSKDLVNWTFRGDVVKMSDPENLGSRWVLERPKVFYNKKTRKYVMYFHLDNRSYKVAKVGIAVSDRPDCQFNFVKSFRPLGHESRDIGQFIDDDGTAYLVFEDRPFGFRIAKLSDDYMNVEKEMSLVKEHMEGGAIVHYKGLYYSIGSSLTGWRPNPNKYADCHLIGRAMVQVQRYSATSNQYLRFSINDGIKGDRYKIYDSYFYGRYMETSKAMGFPIFMDAA